MKIVLLSEGARIPKRADEGSAGYDLYVPKDVIVRYGRNLIPLDIKIELDKGTEAQIRPRSGFSLKGVEGRFLEAMETKRFDCDTLLGTIDESYHGNVGVIIKSNERSPFIIEKGTRIAQMVIAPYCKVEFEVADTLSQSERGEGGFGHTGSK